MFCNDSRDVHWNHPPYEPVASHCNSVQNKLYSTIKHDDTENIYSEASKPQVQSSVYSMVNGDLMGSASVEASI